MAVILALLSSVMWGSSDFLGGTISRRLPAITVVVWSQVAGLVVLIVVALAKGAFNSPVGYLGWGALGGVSTGVALIAFYRALATGTMGVVAPIAALGVAVPVLAGLVSGDRPSALQDVGMAVAVLGIVLASGPELQRKEGSTGAQRRASMQSLLLAVVAAIGFGLVFVAIDHGARTSTVMTLMSMRVVGLVTVLLFALATRLSLRVTVRDLPTFASTDLLGLGANTTFALATGRGLLTVVAVLSNLYPAMTAVLAAVVHEERLGRVQLAGVVAALAGVVLIAAGG
jgi:drug/metabolite transporter (DMT)-like permease